MDAVSAYAFGNFAWMGAQAAPLILWPTFISSLLTPDYQHANSVEIYFARSLGFALLTLGLLVLALSGALPLTSIADETASPYRDAVYLITAFHHASAAFYAYARFNRTGQAGYFMGCLGSTLFAAFGVWCLMFSGDKGRRSKRTGADKRTSGFPFKNSEADKRRSKKL